MRSVDNARDAILFEAVLEIARDECAHGSWDEIEPLLAEAWEELRAEGSLPWDHVADRIRESCVEHHWLH